MKKSLLILGIILAGGGIYWKISHKKSCPSHISCCAPVLGQELAHHLLVYDIFKDKKLLTLIRHGRKNDGGYVVPTLAFEKADVLMGYGVADDISFEEEFCNQYKKPAYAFDGGVQSIGIKNSLCTFISEFIATDKYMYGGQKSSGKITSFEEQIHNFKLENKKFFIKMDIEGAEYQALPAVLKHAPDITGIVLEIHFSPAEKDIKKAINLMKLIEKDFVLCHVHTNNWCNKRIKSDSIKGCIETVLELSYINKNLISRFIVSKSQKHPTSIDMPNNVSEKDTKWEIVQ